jgi:hypothetical protein
MTTPLSFYPEGTFFFNAAIVLQSQLNSNLQGFRESIFLLKRPKKTPQPRLWGFRSWKKLVAYIMPPIPPIPPMPPISGIAGAPPSSAASETMASVVIIKPAIEAAA